MADVYGIAGRERVLLRPSVSSASHPVGTRPLVPASLTEGPQVSFRNAGLWGESLARPRTIRPSCEVRRTSLGGSHGRSFRLRWTRHDASVEQRRRPSLACFD